MSKTELYVIVWAATHYCLHLDITSFLQHDERLPFGVPGVYLALLKTLTELGVGAALVCVAMNEDNVSEKLFIFAFAGHAIGTYAANYLYIVTYPHISQALASKLFEPVTTAVISSLVDKQPLGLLDITSLSCIITGSVLLAYVTVINSVSSHHIALLVLTNICHSVRNIAVKEFKTYGMRVDQRSTVLSVSAVAFYCLMVVREYTCSQRTIFFYPFLLLMTTAIFNVVTSFLSVCVVLKTMSVVTHGVFSGAVCFVSMALEGAGGCSVISSMGCVLFLLGLGIYAKCRHHRSDKEPRFPSLVNNLIERQWRLNHLFVLCLTSSVLFCGLDLLITTVSTLVKTADSAIRV